MPIKDPMPCEMLWRNPDGRFVTDFKANYEGSTGPYWVYPNGFSILCDFVEHQR